MTKKIKTSTIALSAILLFSLTERGNCATPPPPPITSCVTLYYYCYNKGNLICDAFKNTQYYNPKETRTNTMQAAVDACNEGAPSDPGGPCQDGLNVIGDAKMCIPFEKPSDLHKVPLRR